MTDEDLEITDTRLKALEQHAEKERPWRWPVVASFAFSFLTTVLAVALVLQIAERNRQYGIAQRQQIQAVAEERRQALCALIISLDDNTRLDPPITELGKSNAKTYASLRVSQGCPPHTGD